MNKYDVYGLGAALVDTEIEVSDDFIQGAGVEKGMMTLVDEARQSELLESLGAQMDAAHRASGGSAANSMIASSCFGSKVFYSCKVAADENGGFYVNDLSAAGVDHNDNANAESGITGKCLVMITPDAERSMNTFLGISATLSEAELDLEALKASNYFYMEGYLVTSDTGRAAAIKAREVAQANGVKVALSFSDPSIVEIFKPGLEEMLGDKIDLVFCNEAEALSWAGKDSLDEAIEVIKQVSHSFAITRGAQGAVVFDGVNSFDIEPYAVKAVDTNGAGDMFAGAFLHAICQGQGFDEAGKLASLASAQVVSDFGPRLKLGAHKEILAQLQLS